MNPSERKAGTAGTEVAAAARAVLPVLVGVVPFALVFGAVAAKKGLSPLEVGLMSGMVFAGSAQFAAAQLWTAPAAVGALGLTALLINMRHVLMGMAIAPHLAAFPRPARPLALFVMADENWALAMRRGLAGRLTLAYYGTMGVIMWAVWVLTTTVGAVLGAFIEDPAAYGFDFAFVAVFMSLLRGFWKGRSSLVVWAAAALTAIIVSRLVEGPWYVVAGALAGMAAAWLVRIPEAPAP